MKIRNIIASLGILLTAVTAAAQTTPIEINLSQIGVNVTSNPEHYRELTRRFAEGDTTLRPDQIATVYYGYSFTSDYDPRDRYPEVQKAYADKDYAGAIRLIHQAEKYNPVSLDLIVTGVLSAPKLKTDAGRADALRYQRQLDMLVDLILATGTGIVPARPFYVISEGDIDRIITNIIGADIPMGNSGIGELDAYKFRFSGNVREHILYFNNTRQHDFEAQHPQ